MVPITGNMEMNTKKDNTEITVMLLTYPSKILLFVCFIARHTEYTIIIVPFLPCLYRWGR